MNSIYGIILAGGTGSRFSSEIPKQFVELKGKPILVHSVESFKKAGIFKSLTITVPGNFIQKTEEILEPFLDSYDRIIEGGETRHHSTLLALQSIRYSDNDLVILHDAARPFVSQKEIRSVSDAALAYGVASAAQIANDTVVLENSPGNIEILDREKIHLIKTPQGMQSRLIPELLKTKGSKLPTDLCSWALQAGIHAKLVPSNSINMKITNPEDMILATSFKDLT